MKTVILRVQYFEVSHRDGDALSVMYIQVLTSLHWPHLLHIRYEESYMLPPF